MPYDPLKKYVTPDSVTTYYDGATITYAELKDAGFIDWDANEWAVAWHDEATKKRLVGMIEARYSNRDIGILPPAQWRREIVRRLNEIAPKYNAIYAALDGGADILNDSDDYGKQRSVFSDFPATEIKGATQDYAANSTDTEDERISRINIPQFLTQYKDFASVDAAVLDEIEFAFSSLIVAQLNGF